VLTGQNLRGISKIVEGKEAQQFRKEAAGGYTGRDLIKNDL
jgi:hypothetical protein